MASALNILNSFKILLAIEGTVIIDRDVTMDNQQPSPIFKISIFKVGCRSQTKMAVGNFLFLKIRNCLRYSRADYHI